MDERDTSSCIVLRHCRRATFLLEVFEGHNEAFRYYCLFTSFIMSTAISATQLSTFMAPENCTISASTLFPSPPPHALASQRSYDRGMQDHEYISPRAVPIITALLHRVLHCTAAAVLRLPFFFILYRIFWRGPATVRSICSCCSS